MLQGNTYEFKHLDEITLCTIKYKGKNFEGQAILHNEDKDFGNDLTGEIIAAARAEIKVIQYNIDEALSSLNTLHELYSCVKKGSPWATKIISNRIYKQNKIYHGLVAEKRQLKKDLNDFIQAKNRLYIQLRERRKTEKEN